MPMIRQAHREGKTSRSNTAADQGEKDSRKGQERKHHKKRQFLWFCKLPERLRRDWLKKVAGWQKEGTVRL